MIVIKNGTIIDPASNLEAELDLLIKDGLVEAIERPGSFAKMDLETTIDATGMWVTPGLIDLHVHLREPGFEWKETIRSGAEAAVLGGFTSICAMPNTQPANDSAEVTKFVLERARDAALARVHPIGAVTVGRAGTQLAPFSELRKAGCVAFSDDGDPVANAGLMRRALEWCLMLDGVIACHEEDKSLSACGDMNESSLSVRLGLKGWPKVAEEVLIARDIELARATGARVHICHLSTARGVELVRRAKNDGIRLSAEVTPHHLVLTEQAVAEYNTDAKMSPPLRELADLEALHVGLQDGTIDAIASDHAPHEHDSKNLEFGKAAMGILGLQTSLPLLVDFVHRGTISRKRLVEAFSCGPAKVFGLDAGSLARGKVADLVVIDPRKRWSFDRKIVRSKSFNSPFLGRELVGAADCVMVGGRIVVRGGVVRGGVLV